MRGSTSTNIHEGLKLDTSVNSINDKYIQPTDYAIDVGRDKLHIALYYIMQPGFLYYTIGHAVHSIVEP